MSEVTRPFYGGYGARKRSDHGGQFQSQILPNWGLTGLYHVPRRLSHVAYRIVARLVDWRRKQRRPLLATEWPRSRMELADPF